jgi:xylulokinase
MAGERLLLGLDVSTTAVKATLVSATGRVIGVASTAHTLSTPHPLWAEQSPSDWWIGAQRSIHEVLGAAEARGVDVLAVGLTGQMHGLTLLDGHGEILRPAILWNDQRTARQCDEMRARIGKDRLIAICGNDALPGFTAPKILWVREHEPDVYSRVAHVLLPKDYVRLRLTGMHATDKADGSGMMLFDLHRRTWSPELLDALEIPAAWMPEVFEGTEVTGYVTPEAATLTGLTAGTPIVAGGGDQAAGAVGVGAVRDSVIGFALGTSGVVFAPSDTPIIEPSGRLHAFCHAVPDMWHLMGVTLSAAGSLHWYRDTFAPGESFDALVSEAASCPAGCDGLLFLPYLAGERTPYPDPLARGAFIGLTLRHTRAHLTRAVLEGVAYSLADCLGLVREARLSTAVRSRVTGGGAQSALWRRILASVLRTPVSPVDAVEGAAFGAALLAGVGAGVWSDVRTACEHTIRLGEPALPDPEATERYQRSYAIYRDLYPALRDTFQRLSATE